jgi:hypothetical protein
VLKDFRSGIGLGSPEDRYRILPPYCPITPLDLADLLTFLQELSQKPAA